MTNHGDAKKRLKIEIKGTVQGVGFRPFVWRLANELDVKGWVVNGVRGVVIEAEASESTLLEFLRRLSDDAPVVSSIESKKHLFLQDTVSYETFDIRESDDVGEKTALVLRVYEDLSFNEIAEIMDCPYDTAKANYRHALMKLRQTFEQQQELKNWTEEVGGFFTEMNHRYAEAEG